MTAEVIPFNAPKPVLRLCSFCKAPEAQAKHFWVGADGHCICGACVVKAKQRLDQTK